MSPDPERPDSEAAEVLDSARSIENEIQRLCRATLSRPIMMPAEVDVVLAHLSAVAGALPQTLSQLGDILDRADRHHVLEMDTLTTSQDARLALDTARLHLQTVRELAFDLYRHLDAAHNQTAHIAVVVHRVEGAERSALSVPLPTHRPEERQPPPMGSSGPGRGPTR